ncbi:MAG: N-acyl amino acid synthase of PEP-CTERM/exosortase system [Halieaceae bacterium]
MSNSKKENTKSSNPEMSTLFMDFAQYFELQLALTEEQKSQVYHVRYRVYCEEFGYEPAEHFQNHMEIDAYDEHSIHCLVMHRSTGRPAGTVRVVSMDSEDSALPLEDHCRDSLDPMYLAKKSHMQAQMCELSRLAVDSDFRRRHGEKETRFGNTQTLHFAAREQRTFSLIAISLFLSGFAVADIMRRHEVFAIMEPFLPAILRRTGINVTRVGEDFEFNGLRAPYYQNVDDIIRGVPDELRLCYEMVRSQFAAELLPDRNRKVSRVIPGAQGDSRKQHDVQKQGFTLPWLTPGLVLAG